MAEIAFIAISFSFTYCAWGYAVFLDPKNKLRGPLVVIGGAGPALGALVTTSLGLSSFVSFEQVFGSLFIMPNWKLALFATLTPMCIIVFGMLIVKRYFPKFLHNSLHAPTLDKPSSLYPSLPGVFLYLLFMLGFPMLVFEELGWRMFLLPQLFGRLHSKTLASIFVGIFWAFWHLPLFYCGPNPKVAPHPLAAATPRLIPHRIVVYAIELAFLSIIMTWFQYQGAGSVWISVLFHASFNSSFAIFKLERDVVSVFPVALVVLPPISLLVSLMAF